jgi:6-phosphogluconolactonase
MNSSVTLRDGALSRRDLLQGAALAAVGPTAFAAGGPASAKARQMFAYVGAFTTPQRKGHGDGINVYRMDPRTGAWTHVQRVPDIVNPSFLALDRRQSFLYSVHADLDQVSAYAMDKNSGQLAPLNKQSCGGKNPVFLSLDPSNRYIVTANYTGGSLGVVAIKEDGTLGKQTDVVPLTGEPGPNRKEQTGSHPHDCPFDPAGRFVVVPDKGLDLIFAFRLHAATGKLVANDPPSVATRSGAGPRHIAFHPSLPFAYVINELGSTMTTYRYDGARGVLTAVQVLPTTPENFTGDNTGAEVAVAPSGRFVYGSNRGHDSIVIFAVDRAHGTLTPIDWVSTQGRTPRFFALDPAANFLYAANHDTDTIVTFRVNGRNGRLTPTGQIVKVGSPCTNRLHRHLVTLGPTSVTKSSPNPARTREFAPCPNVCAGLSGLDMPLLFRFGRYQASRPRAGRAMPGPTSANSRAARCSASCLSNIALAAALRLPLNSARLSPHHW